MRHMFQLPRHCPGVLSPEWGIRAFDVVERWHLYLDVPLLKFIGDQGPAERANKGTGDQDKYVLHSQSFR